MKSQTSRHCWFSFFPQDFYCGTLTMKPEVVGGYIRLLCIEWINGPIPLKDEQLLRLTGVSEEALAEIKSKFRICERTSGGNVLVNDRLEKDREVANDKITKSKENARIRWEKERQNSQNDQSVAKEMPLHMPSHVPAACLPQSHIYKDKDNDASLNFDIRTEQNGDTTWMPTQEQIAQLQKTFPAVDVIGECRKAALWCHDNPSKRKTARGMPRFLATWMSNSKPKTAPVPVEEPPTPQFKKLDLSEMPEFWRNHILKGMR